jgi:hypothetical protein
LRRGKNVAIELNEAEEKDGADDVVEEEGEVEVERKTNA